MISEFGCIIWDTEHRQEFRHRDDETLAESKRWDLTVPCGSEGAVPTQTEQLPGLFDGDGRTIP